MTTITMFLVSFIYGAVVIFFVMMALRLVKAVEKIALLLERQQK